MTRRKTRPLLPHEVMSLCSSQESMDNATSSPYSIDDSSQPTLNSSQSSVIQSQLSPEIIHETSKPLGASAEGEVVARTKKNADATFNSTTSSKSEAARDMKAQESSLPTAPAKGGLGYLANRRSAPFAICHDDHVDVQSVTVREDQERISQAEKTTLELKRTSSTIRLSTSLDGKAQITTSNKSSTPAGPLPVTTVIPRHKCGLQRSQSAIEPTNVSPAYPRHSVTGRSRDARTWEFYCESDKHDALTEQAEREQSGSAIAPIGLIRSRSNQAVVQNTNKRIATASKHEPTKRQKADGQLTNKPKLARTTSSVARLQSVTGNVQKQVTKAKDKPKKPSSQSALDDYYSGDSDKENWVPGTRTSNMRRPRSGNSNPSNQTRRAILEESQRARSQSSSLDALMNSQDLSPRRPGFKKVSNGQKATGSKVDDKVTALVGPVSEPSEEPEDLDCVQNLLSLSQAKWQ